MREDGGGSGIPSTVQRRRSGGIRWTEVTEFVAIEHRTQTEAQVRQRAARQGIEFTRRGDGAAGCDDRLMVVAAPEIEMESYFWQFFFEKTVREGIGGRGVFLLVLLMVMNSGS